MHNERQNLRETRYGIFEFSDFCTQIQNSLSVFVQFSKPQGLWAIKERKLSGSSQSFILEKNKLIFQILYRLMHMTVTYKKEKDGPT